MLLKELKEGQLNEKFVDIEVKMTLQKIIDDGKITDGAQTSVLVTLLGLLETGKIETISNLRDAPGQSSELVAFIKELDDKKVVKMAQELLAIMDAKDADNDCMNRTVSDEPDEMETSDWVAQSARAQK
jgi:hypothetical protein